MTPDQHSGPGPHSASHPEMDELIAYAMGTPAPTEAERTAMDRVRLHLTECAECRTQVAQIRSDLALAAMAVPQIAPPPEAKARLFQVAGLELNRTSAPAAAPEKVVSIQRRRFSPGVMWIGWAAAAACLLYAVHVRDTSQAIRQQLRLETAQLIQRTDSSARARQVLDLLNSPQAQRVTLIAAHTKPQPTGHAVYLPSRGALVFTASNLAPLPENKTYELWVIPANGSAPIPAGTFQPNAHGMASLVLPKLPHGVPAKAFGVTMEKAGGATKPTLPILLAGG